MEGFEGVGPVGLVGRLKPACAGGVGRPAVGVLRKKRKNTIGLQAC